jgi:ketosteroid isomerase-like protein
VPETNVQLVRRSFDAFGRGDLDTLLADLAPAFKFEPSGRFVDTQRVYRGRDGFTEFWHAFRGAWKDIAIHIERMEDLGDRVLTLGYFHGHGGGSGAEITAEGAWLHAVKGGQIVHLRSFSSWAEAQAAVARSDG